MAIRSHGVGKSGELEYRRWSKNEDQKRTPKKCPACKSSEVSMVAGVFSCKKCGYVNKPTPASLVIK